MMMKKIVAGLNSDGTASISIEDCPVAVAVNNDENRHRIHVENQQKKLTDSIHILDELTDNRADDEFYIIPEPIQSVAVAVWINKNSDRVGFIVPHTSLNDNMEFDVIEGANALCDLIGLPRIEGLEKTKDLKKPLQFITRIFAESLGKKRALFTEEQLKKFQSNKALYAKLLENPPEMLRYIDKRYVIEDSVNMLRVMLELQIGGKLLDPDARPSRG